MGTSFGIVLHRMFPEWLILLALTILLVFMTYTTGKKGIKLWRNESMKLLIESGEKEDAREPKIIESEASNPPKIKEVEIQGGHLSKDSDEINESQTKDEDPPSKELDKDLLNGSLKHLVDGESKQWPVIPLCAIAGVIISVCLFSLFKGGRKMDSIVGIEQ